jgi:hypothetical protein
LIVDRSAHLAEGETLLGRQEFADRFRIAAFDVEHEDAVAREVHWRGAAALEHSGPRLPRKLGGGEDPAAL